MEINSSGEELVLKTRKPYTITKQRERWTEEEHFRFLDAVKRYGRSWQRIEDHIGTKTAVQIRSHAQKFFTKLEKESVARGTPLGQAHDIDIPPPRPKRKPNSPYPRKTGACVSPAAEAVDENASKHVTSQETTREDISLKINAQTEVSAVTKSVQGIGSCSDGDKCSAVLQETLSTSVSAGHNGSTNPISFKEFVPIVNEPKEVYSIGGASLPFERNLQSSINGRNKPDHDLGKISKINKDLHALHKSSVLGEMFGVQKHLVKQSENDMQKSDPNRKVQDANGLHSANTHKSNSEVTAESVEFPSITSPFMNHRISAAPGLQSSLAMSSFPPFVTFPPFSVFRSPQDFYRSFFGISSNFSSLVVSTLLQNPAVHAAACMAASLWPSGEMDPLTESSSMASIVGATVAAAASWWASQGLIPVGPIHDTGLSFPFQPNAIHEANTGQFSKGKKEERETHQNPSKTYQQDVCHVGLGDLNTQSSPPKSTLSSLSDSEEFENDASNVNKLKPVPGTVACHSSDNSKLSKKPERSSCGSNTPSSSEVETDAALKTNGEANDGGQQVPFQNFPMSEEVNTRRARSSWSMNDSWKEVSQEGRVAFQALFARNVLPQTFALQHAKIDPGFSKDLVMGRDKVSQSNFLPKETSHGDPKLRRTGFKPYKRCSAEVDANRSSINGETGNKRIRREGEASSFS